MGDVFDSGIRPAIDEYLARKTAEERDYGDYWSASSAGHCYRRLIFERLKVPPVPEMEEGDAIKTRVFEAGHIFHEWLQRITKDAGLSIAQEVELQDENLMVRGHFDDLVLIDGKLILYDYKTQHSEAFTWQKGKPLSYFHRLQVATYMYMLRSLVLPIDLVVNTEDLSEARVMKISKDDLRLREDQVPYTDKLEAEVLEYWNGLNVWWDSRKIPPCTCLDHEGGFMGKRSSRGKIYNNYFWQDEPCSLEWFKRFKEKI